MVIHRKLVIPLPPLLSPLRPNVGILSYNCVHLVRPTRPRRPYRWPWAGRCAAASCDAVTTSARLPAIPVPARPAPSPCASPASARPPATRYSGEEGKKEIRKEGKRGKRDEGRGGWVGKDIVHNSRGKKVSSVSVQCHK